MDGDSLQLTLSVGSLVGVPMIGFLLYLAWSNHRRLKRIEKLVTPVKTDSRGVRYFPPHEELGIDLDPQVVADLRRKHEDRMRDMSSERLR